MAEGYENVPRDSLEVLTRKIEEQNRRIAELEKPTGTQLADAVARLEALQAVSSTTSSTFSFLSAGWASTSGLPSVTIDTPSGNLKVTVSGTIYCATTSGARSALTFSIGSEVTAASNVTAVTSGSYPGATGTSFGLVAVRVDSTDGGVASGSYSTVVTGLTPGTKTVQLEAWASGLIAILAGCSIIVEVIP